MEGADCVSEVGGHADAGERSVGELTSNLAAQTSLLVRQELALARLELQAKAKQAGTGIGFFGAAAVLALFVVGALVAGAVAALGLAIAIWSAALIVAGCLLLAVGVAGLVGVRLLQRAAPPVPQQAAESVKEDVRWAKVRAQQARQ
jgi:Putative Actinobacterial Holin-X, holin superfamily III